MLIATLSYSKFESIQLQHEESAEKSDESGNMLLFFKCWGDWHCYLLTDHLRSLFAVKRMWPKWD